MGANADAARRAIAAFNDADADAIEAFCAEDVRIVPMRAALEDVSYSGPGAVRRFLADLGQEWSKLEMDLDDYAEDGDRVTANGVLRGMARASGAAVEMHVTSECTFRDGLITEIRTAPA